MVDVEDVVIVSVDDHVIEPRDAFEGRFPAKFAEDAPRVVTVDGGRETWLFEGRECTNFGLNAVAGKAPEEYNLDPTTYSNMRAGCYDVHERVRDMNLNGIMASMNFPSFPKFAGQTFCQANDKELAYWSVRAYNDWMIEDWCGAYPDRFIPLCLVPLWDPELAAAEVERIAGLGAHAITFPENPVPLGYPSFHNAAWEPMISALEETGVVLCLHIGSSSKTPILSNEAPMTVMLNLLPLNAMQAAADVLWSPIPRRHPRIKIALSEGGIGWVPYFLERADFTYQHHKAWTGQDFGDLLPSDVFHRNFWTCTIDDEVGLQHLDLIGADHVMWEVDYPHSDSTWPLSPENMAKRMDGIDDDVVADISHRTALELFQHRPSELLTVGQLRALEA